MRSKVHNTWQAYTSPRMHELFQFKLKSILSKEIVSEFFKRNVLEFRHFAPAQSFWAGPAPGDC